MELCPKIMEDVAVYTILVATMCIIASQNRELVVLALSYSDPFTPQKVDKRTALEAGPL